MTTIGEYADRARISVSEVKKRLRDRFPDRKRQYASPDHRLGAEEIAALGAPAHASLVELPGPPASRPAPPARPPLRLAQPSAQVARRAHAGTRLRVHQDMLDWMERAPPTLRAAALRAMEALVAYGHPNRVKGVKGVNKGWLRTPVGGTSGMQWYLWYAGRGASPVGDRLGDGEILVRGVRHHDETPTPIVAGAEDDWLPWTPADLLAEEDATDERTGHPLTGAQRSVVTSLAPVQVIRGTPGAGKTTALLHGVRRLPGAVVYVTFNTTLGDRAKAWLHLFCAEAEGQVSVYTMPSLLARQGRLPLLPEPDPRTVARTLRTRLDPHVAELGPWREGPRFDPALLHAELHAQVFGRCMPEGRVERGVYLDALDLSTGGAAYVAERAPAIGREAAEAAWRAARLLLPDEQQLFPGPALARAAKALADAGDVAPDLAAIDWIVVDEVQDLTLVEIGALTSLVSAIGRARGGRAPGLRVSGDEGQTLRPTAFAWSDLEQALRSIGKPEPQALDVNLRSSREVAAFLQQVTDVLYRQLPKGVRPRGQRRAGIEPASGGEVLLVRAPAERLDDVLAAVAGIDALIVPDRQVPPALAEAARRRNVRVLSSLQAKGLDFCVVGVVDLGPTVAEVHELVTEGSIASLALEHARARADHARVAVSRAVDRLVLVELTTGDARDDARARVAIERLFAGEAHDTDAKVGLPDPSPLAELAEALDLDTGDALGSLHVAISTCEGLVGRTPRDALVEADRAARDLRRAGRTGAIDQALRRHVHTLRARCRLEVALASEDPAERSRLLEQAARAFRDAETRDLAAALDALRKADGTDRTGATEVQAAIDARKDLRASKGTHAWVSDRLEAELDRALARTLDRVHTPSIAQADALLGALRTVPQTELGQMRASADRALEEALTTLAASRERAEDVLAVTASLDDRGSLRARATAYTTLGREEAIEGWVRIGEPERALAVLRAKGRIEDALEHARRYGLEPPPELVRAIKLVEALRNVGELTPAEREQLAERAAAALGRVAKKRR